MPRLSQLGAILVGCGLAGACAARVGSDAFRRAPLLELPGNVLPAGAYHGTTFFFEIDLRLDPSGRLIDSDDIPGLGRWFENEKNKASGYYRELPPIQPEALPDGREVYRLGKVHRVEYANSMFQVGPYRYLRSDKARLYVFKPRRDFSFRFRGQTVLVPSAEPWTPSVYYYPEEAFEGGRKRIVREVVQVGLSSIEAFPSGGRWLVDGKPFYPSDRPLVLRDALHVRGY